ncbi:MAG: alpha/beta hydrolase-fold protein [Pedococcus sp.]
MPLLGWPLVATLGSVLVLLVGATGLFWGRVHGPRILRLAQRVLLVGATQVLVVLLLAAGANDYGYFYGSWSDLFGGSTQAVQLPPTHGAPAPRQGHVGAAGALPAVPGGPTAWSTPGQWATRGRVDSLTVQGARSALSGQASIYLPPEYFRPASAHRTFPAVEVMTGYPGVVANLVQRQHYPDVLLAELAQRRAGPMVLVMLRPTVAPPRDTECTDVPGGPQALTYLSQDVPAAVESAYRVRPLGWGAMGDSTGGYCAVKLAMARSDVFTSAVSLSGYYHTLRDATTGDLWGGSSVVRDLNSPEWLLAHQPAPPISVLATIGTSEVGHTGISDTRRFLSLVKSPMSVSSVVIPGGGHNFHTWSTVMGPAMDWLSKRLNAGAA